MTCHIRLGRWLRRGGIEGLVGTVRKEWVLPYKGEME